MSEPKRLFFALELPEEVQQRIVDWRALHAALAAQTRCAFLVAEHDNPSDFNRFAAQAVATYRSF